MKWLILSVAAGLCLAVALLLSARTSTQSVSNYFFLAPSGSVSDSTNDHGSPSGSQEQQQQSQQQNERQRRLHAIPSEAEAAPIRIFGPALDDYSNSNGEKKGVTLTWSTTAQQRQFLLEHGRACWPSSSSSSSSSGAAAAANVVDNALLQRFDDFAPAPFLQVELWKFCVFYTAQGNVFWDRSQVAPLVTWADLWADTSTSGTGSAGTDQTTALLVTLPSPASSASTTTNANAASWIHSSFLRLDAKYAATLSRTMMRLLLETEQVALTSNPLYTYQALAQHIQNDDLLSNNLWNVHCQVPSPANPADQVLVQRPRPRRRRRHLQKNRLALNVDDNDGTPPPEFSQLPTFGLHCTIPGGYCCQVWSNDGDEEEDDQDQDTVLDHQSGQQPPILMVKHPFGTSGGTTTTITTATPAKTTTATTTATTTKTAHKKRQYPSDPVPYWSTVTAVPTGDITPRSKLETPNFFDILLQNNCLPTSPVCHACLKKYTSTTGCDEQCTQECPCYCKVLCQIRPPPKHVQAVWYVSPPLVQLPEPRPQRLIPRIVHQTWYEPLEPDKYPNMSRLQQSWKQSGWTHKFYDDATAATFLQEHFPPPVLEAYHAIQPGAFKADLFRYCVLLIQGGVYADMDVLLETNLEEAIAPNVGFMTPMDEPGIKVGQQACLWNGFMAVAPGHPFVAKTIELVVNNIRNRFTSVDYDDMLCPNPILSASHLWDILFTTGPCILGTAMNLVLQRHPQTGFTTGEIDIWGGNPSTGAADDKEFSPQQQQPGEHSSTPPPHVEPNDPRLAIPGRSIILRQNKNDMGAHRFTLEERNLVVCSTDMPDYDDRPKKPHYAESGKQSALYGTTQLYSDFSSANEEIRVVVVGNPSNYTV